MPFVSLIVFVRTQKPWQKKPLTCRRKNWNLPSIFVVFLFTSVCSTQGTICRMPPTAQCMLILCSRRFYSNPPYGFVRFLVHFCKKKQTNTISHPAVRFPKHPAWTGRFCFPSRRLLLFIYGWQYPCTARTHNMIGCHKTREMEESPKQGADKTWRGRRIITYVRYISPSICINFIFGTTRFEVRHVSVK